jgi:hypothetical protein
MSAPDPGKAPSTGGRGDNPPSPSTREERVDDDRRGVERAVYERRNKPDPSPAEGEDARKGDNS